MQIKFSVLAAVIISSVASLSGQVRDGSNSSRAPLPANRSSEFMTVINAKSPTNTSLVANHIGGPRSTQVVTVRTPKATKVPAVARVEAAAPTGSSTNE